MFNNLNKRANRGSRLGSRAGGSALLFMLLVVPTGVDGQAIHVGITGGWASTSQVSDESRHGREGHAVGLVARLTIADVLAFQVEVQDVERGFGKRNEGARLHQNYVEVPVLLVATLPSRWQSLRPELTLGVAPARERSCEAWTVPMTVGLTTPDLQPEPCSAWRNQTTDVGAVLGGGVSLDVGRSLVNLSLRYTRGTKAVWESEHIPEVYNRAVVLGVSGMLPVCICGR